MLLVAGFTIVSTVVSLSGAFQAYWQDVNSDFAIGAMLHRLIAALLATAVLAIAKVSIFRTTAPLRRK